MTKIETLRRKALLVLATLALAGCQTMPMLPNGGRSGMDEDNSRIRGQLDIYPIPLPHRPAYAPVAGCSYRVSVFAMGGAATESVQELSIRRVRDRLLVRSTEGLNVSTALIGDDGRLYDFNVVGSDGTRATQDTFGRIATRQAEELRDGGEGGVHVINNLTVAFPRYLQDQFEVGDVVAHVTDENNNPWASFVYRGASNYNGYQAIVLDLVRQPEISPNVGPLTVGFSIINVSNALPLLYVVDAGYKMHVEQIACR